MERRRLAALVLAWAAFSLALVFGILTWVCGMRSISPGATESRCVSAFHPWVPFWMGFAVAGGVGLALGRAWPALLLGAVGFVMGVLSGFSAGLFGLGSGALLLAAGLVGRRRRR